MKTFKKIIRVIIRCITIPLIFAWTFPQSLLGLFMIFPGMKLVGLKEVIWKYSSVSFITSNMRGGVSLGIFIFISTSNATTRKERKQVVKHEVGHYWQSLILGPLYLIIVGIPSFIRSRRFAGTQGAERLKYYKGFPENWADKLGGVKRDKS